MIAKIKPTTIAITSITPKTLRSPFLYSDIQFPVGTHHKQKSMSAITTGINTNAIIMTITMEV